MAIAVKPPPADVSLSDNLCWLLARASQSLTVQLTAALAELGLSPRAHCVLSTAIAGEYTQTALAHAVGLDKTTMVVTLDDLEASGLAERRLSATDRRARIVAVTTAGAAADSERWARARRRAGRAGARAARTAPARRAGRRPGR